ncbi:MAG: PPK2 family polyphosphate kinase [Ilumatobacteraceae bacterium]
MTERLRRQLLVRSSRPVDLDQWPSDETFGWNKDAAKDELSKVIGEMAFIQRRLMAEATQSLLVVLQGRDASGKDGLVRHVMTGLNPAGVRVVSFKVPAGVEKDHDYLWRCHKAVPARGQVGVWNRSHYEDILVPRVKGLVAEDVWRRRYRHVRDFEQLLADEGTRVLKFYLNVSHEVQRQRLQKRIDNPESSWKHDPSDLSDREIWPLYEEAYADVLRETSRPHAPWYVVPADNKWVRDLVVARIMLDELVDMNPQLPLAEKTLKGTTVV